jgi:hypothetical protein
MPTGRAATTQYANRLAHLQFLRDRRVDAHLVFVYFLDDAEMHGGASQAQWDEAIAACHRALGLSDGKAEGVHSVFVSVAETAGRR